MPPGWMDTPPKLSEAHQYLHQGVPVELAILLRAATQVTLQRCPVEVPPLYGTWRCFHENVAGLQAHQRGGNMPPAALDTSLLPVGMHVRLVRCPPPVCRHPQSPGSPH